MPLSFDSPFYMSMDSDLFLYSIHEDSMIELPLCPKNKSTPKPTKFLYGDYSHHSQFFVFIGVTNMIYVLVVLLVYICLPDWYNQEQTPKWVS